MKGALPPCCMDPAGIQQNQALVEIDRFRSIERFQRVSVSMQRGAGVVLGPVGHPVPLLRNVAATGCLGFERHGRDPSVRKGAVVLHRPAPDANRPIHATRSSRDASDPE
jgi:hypothetical protein